MAESTTEHFFDGGGSMGAAIRTYDWASTPLGRIDAWPAALRIAVGMMLASKFPMCVAWGDDFITLYNDAFRPILGGKPQALGKSFRVVWSEAWDVIGPIAARAYAGEATFIEDFPLVVERHGYAEQTYFTFCYSPIRDETGRIVGMLDTVVETTAKINAEKTAALLNSELAHRLQNTLATVSAMADQTFRSTRSKDEMQTILAQRIAALGRAHSMLTESSWSGAPLRTVIESALAPHRRDQISVEGPHINLSARHSLSLALAIHELATNALKYGALSVEAGHVAIRWETGAPGSEDTFRLTWIERNGPAVRTPSRRGFGSRLIEDMLAEEFHGSVHLTYESKGVRCELIAQMKHLGVTQWSDLGSAHPVDG